MTAVIASPQFSIDADNIDWLQRVAPDIESVTLADSTEQMCADVCACSSPVVTMVGGDRSEIDLHAVADAFEDDATQGGMVAVSSDRDSARVTQAFLDGVRGWVLADSPVEELLTGIRAVASGHMFLPAELMCSLATTLPIIAFESQGHRLRLDLTRRESDVAELLAVGKANAQIAADLFISQATVHSHVLNILRKLNAQNRTEAVARIYQLGMTSGSAAVAATLP